jgi:hypothetical protein
MRAVQLRRKKKLFLFVLQLLVRQISVALRADRAYVPPAAIRARVPSWVVRARTQ